MRDKARVRVRKSRNGGSKARAVRRALEYIGNLGFPPTSQAPAGKCNKLNETEASNSSLMPIDIFRISYKRAGEILPRTERGDGIQTICLKMIQDPDIFSR